MSIPALIARPLAVRAISYITAGEDAEVCRGAPICAGVWADVRGHAGDTYDFTRTGTVYFVDIQCCGTTDQFQSITRAIFVFDLSGESGTKAGAKLKLRVTGKTETLGSQSVVVTDATPADASLLVYTDYANVGTTAYSSTMAISGITIDTYITLDLNATALSAINTAVGAGSVSIGLRLEADRGNSAPTWSSGVKAQLDFASRNNATAAYRPQLMLW